MGILNVTPDSFSEGGRYHAPEAAVARGLALFAAGADIVDVGGESTRPGAAMVDPIEERRRVVPVIEALRRATPGFISVDTSKAEVARAALDAGADLVNDVSGFSFDPGLARLVAQTRVAAVIMHLRGNFRTMHEVSHYDDVMGEVVVELESTLKGALEAGVDREALLVDPGIGFSKEPRQSLDILRRLPELAVLGRPILVGPSRKRFLAGLVSGSLPDRVMGTSAAVAACVLKGAHVVRVHDVAEMADVVRVADAIRGDQ
jgi:dihydropteroate synthase